MWPFGTYLIKLLGSCVPYIIIFFIFAVVFHIQLYGYQVLFNPLKTKINVNGM
jgi:hypothetical protein